jgi:hypothetical protein
MNSSLEVKKNTVDCEGGAEIAVGTPCSNTGLNSHISGYEVGLDWLDFSVRSLSGSVQAQLVIDDLERLIKDQIDFSPTRAAFNGRSWDGSGRGLSGVMLWYKDPVLDDCVLSRNGLGEYIGYEDVLPPPWCPIDAPALSAIREKLPEEIVLEFCPWLADGVVDHGYRLALLNKVEDIPGILKVAMSGSVIARCSERSLYEFLKKWKIVDFSRVDVALDDMERAVEIARVVDAAATGNFFDAVSTTTISSSSRGGAVGQTVYFGSPSSDKRLRVYDKTVESKGSRDCIRWEVEFRRKKSVAFMDSWMSAMSKSDDKALQLMVSSVVGAVDFRQRHLSGDKERARCKSLVWWVAMKKRLSSEGIRIRVPVVVQSLQRGIDWIKRAVAPTLSAVCTVLGQNAKSFMDELMYEGAVRMSSQKRELVRVTVESDLCY